MAEDGWQSTGTFVSVDVVSTPCAKTATLAFSTRLTVPSASRFSTCHMERSPSVLAGTTKALSFKRY